MLHRRFGTDVIAISQPAHAWISGQLARHWGGPDSDFATSEPGLQIAAEQHDIAWLEWETAPTLNRATGLPYTFSELPTLQHLQVWGRAREWAINYGRLPALLVSMHGTYLYERFHDFDADSTDEAQAARAFLEQERDHQAQLMESLQRERDISQSRITTIRRLISLWDAMSLRLCLGIEDSATFSDVPTTAGDVDLTLRRLTTRAETFSLDPWPFGSDSVDLACEGRVLRGTFDDERSMREALAGAAWHAVEFRLVPS